MIFFFNISHNRTTNTYNNSLDKHHRSPSPKLKKSNNFPKNKIHRPRAGRAPAKNPVGKSGNSFRHPSSKLGVCAEAIIIEFRQYQTSIRRAARSSRSMNHGKLLTAIRTKGDLPVPPTFAHPSGG